MKAYPAIALLEFSDIAAGIHATDAVIKKAPIAVLKSGTISQGRFLTLIGGSTASVEESYREGLRCARDRVLDHVFLPDVHPDVHEAVLGRRATEDMAGSLAILETRTIACNVWAAELALKGTAVCLVELRISDSWLAGKGLSVYRGELHDVEAAMRIAIPSLEAAGKEHSYRIVTQPHDALAQQVGESTHFVHSTLLDLKGEKA